MDARSKLRKALTKSKGSSNNSTAPHVESDKDNPHFREGKRHAKYGKPSQDHKIIGAENKKAYSAGYEHGSKKKSPSGRGADVVKLKENAEAVEEGYRRVIKVNSKGKRRIRKLCGKGKKLIGGTRCATITGKEKAVLRRAGLRRRRTVRGLGAGHRMRSNRLRARAMIKRKAIVGKKRTLI